MSSNLTNESFILPLSTTSRVGDAMRVVVEEAPEPEELTTVVWVVVGSEPSKTLSSRLRPWFRFETDSNTTIRFKSNGVSSWVRALVAVAVASSFATEWSESANITLDDCGTFVSSSTHLDSAASHSTIDESSVTDCTGLVGRLMDA
uniref:(northern house mosquito) hypothetical protein n=1 Tax=Culex pipiens TaxID=7175 RepID=A0A8D8MUT9_CULPI